MDKDDAMVAILEFLFYLETLDDSKFVSWRTQLIPKSGSHCDFVIIIIIIIIIIIYLFI